MNMHGNRVLKPGFSDGKLLSDVHERETAGYSPPVSGAGLKIDGQRLIQL